MASLRYRAAVFLGAVMQVSAACGLPLGAVVNFDGKSLTLFDLQPAVHFAGEIPLPADALPVDVAICRLADRRLVGAASDLGGFVHLFDPVQASYLARVPVSLPAVDVTCCGGYLVVSGGALGLRQRPRAWLKDLGAPAVVDLTARREVFQADPALPPTVAVECTARGTQVLAADSFDNRIHLLDLDARTGQLSDSGVTPQPSAGPSNVFLSSDGRCAVALDDGSHTATGLVLPGLQGTPPAVPSPALVLLGGCAIANFAYVLTPGKIDLFPQDGTCALPPAPPLSFAVGRPVLDQFAGADSVACGDFRVLVAEDGGDGTPDGDAVGIYHPSTGERLGTFRHPSLDGPLGIALSPPPLAVEVPTLSNTALFLLALALAAAGVRRARRQQVNAAVNGTGGNRSTQTRDGG